MAIVQVLLLSTNPYLAVVVAYGALMGLSFVACTNTIYDMYNYWTTGDSKYASNIIRDLVLDIGISVALGGLSDLLPSSDILSKNVINNLDEISDVISRYGDEGLEIINKYGDDAARIIKGYRDDGLISLYYYGDDLIKHTTKYGDEVVEWTVKYGEETIEVLGKYGDDADRIIRAYGEDGLTALYNHGDELIELVSKYGDETVDVVVKYGYDSVRGLKIGIEPSLIERLDEVGIKPSEYEGYGISNKKIAEGVYKSRKNIIDIIHDNGLTLDEFNKFGNIIPEYQAMNADISHGDQLYEISKD